MHREELSQLLYAMRLSVASDGEESGSEEDEENDEVDEMSLVSQVPKEEKKKWEEAWEDEEKEGWSRQHSPLLVHPFNSKPPPPLASCTTPLDFFHAMIPLTFFTYITENINAYAEATRGAGKENDNPNEQKRDNEWKPTTVNEVLAFVGCIIAKGGVISASHCAVPS